jgi:hypothetical protein
MGSNRSQKLDIADICDDVAGISTHVGTIATAATAETLTIPQAKAASMAEEQLILLREVVFHLRVLTGENLTEEGL